MRLGPQGDRGAKPAPFYESAEPNISAASYFGMACLAEHTRRLVGATFASVNLVRTRLSAGGRWIRTCMGLFLSSGCLGSADSFDRDAADPAAFGANALAEPTAESIVGLVSHPTNHYPGRISETGLRGLTPIASPVAGGEVLLVTVEGSAPRMPRRARPRRS